PSGTRFGVGRLPQHGTEQFEIDYEVADHGVLSQVSGYEVTTNMGEMSCISLEEGRAHLVKSAFIEVQEHNIAFRRLERGGLPLRTRWRALRQRLRGSCESCRSLRCRGHRVRFWKPAVARRQCARPAAPA